MTASHNGEFEFSLGRVEDNSDKDKQGKVKVRLMTNGDPSLKDTPAIREADLKWYEPCFLGSGYEVGSFTVPPVGSYVWCAINDYGRNEAHRVYLGSSYGTGSKEPKKFNNMTTPAGVTEVPSEALIDYPNTQLLYKSTQGSFLKFMGDTLGGFELSTGIPIYNSDNIPQETPDDPTYNIIRGDRKTITIGIAEMPDRIDKDNPAVPEPTNINYRTMDSDNISDFASRKRGTSTYNSIVMDNNGATSKQLGDGGHNESSVNKTNEDALQRKEEEAPHTIEEGQAEAGKALEENENRITEEAAEEGNDTIDNIIENAAKTDNSENSETSKNEAREAHDALNSIALKVPGGISTVKSVFSLCIKGNTKGLVSLATNMAMQTLFPLLEQALNDALRGALSCIDTEEASKFVEKVFGFANIDKLRGKASEAINNFGAELGPAGDLITRFGNTTLELATSQLASMNSYIAKLNNLSSIMAMSSGVFSQVQSLISMVYPAFNDIISKQVAEALDYMALHPSDGVLGRLIEQGDYGKVSEYLNTRNGGKSSYFVETEDVSWGTVAVSAITSAYPDASLIGLPLAMIVEASDNARKDYNKKKEEKEKEEKEKEEADSENQNKEDSNSENNNNNNESQENGNEGNGDAGDSDNNSGNGNSGNSGQEDTGSDNGEAGEENPAPGETEGNGNNEDNQEPSGGNTAEGKGGLTPEQIDGLGKATNQATAKMGQVINDGMNKSITTAASRGNSMMARLSFIKTPPELKEWENGFNVDAKGASISVPGFQNQNCIRVDVDKIDMRVGDDSISYIDTNNIINIIQGTKENADKCSLNVQASDGFGTLIEGTETEKGSEGQKDKITYFDSRCVQTDRDFDERVTEFSDNGLYTASSYMDSGCRNFDITSMGYETYFHLGQTFYESKAKDIKKEKYSFLEGDTNKIASEVSDLKEKKSISNTKQTSEDIRISVENTEKKQKTYALMDRESLVMKTGKGQHCYISMKEDEEGNAVIRLHANDNNYLEVSDKGIKLVSSGTQGSIDLTSSRYLTMNANNITEKAKLMQISQNDGNSLVISNQGATLKGNLKAVSTNVDISASGKTTITGNTKISGGRIDLG